MEYIKLLSFLTCLLSNEVEMLECYQCVDIDDFECLVSSSNKSGMDTYVNKSKCKGHQSNIVQCDNSNNSCEITILPDKCGSLGKT